MRACVICLFAALVVSAAGCGGDDGNGEGSTLASKQAPSRYGYAPSHLTPLADKVTDIAFAALRGQPIPQNGILVQPTDPSTQLVRQDLSSPMFADQVTVIGFAIEADVVLRPGAADPYGGLGGLGGGLGGGGDGSLDVLFLLHRSGLRLAGLEVRGPREALPLPPQLAGVGHASAEVLGSLRDGSATVKTLHEGDRVALGDDALYREIADERPSLQTLERAKALAVGVPQALGYRVDDAVILTRSPDGRVWTLGMDFEHGAGGVAMLESRPLVNVRRFGGSGF